MKKTFCFIFALLCGLSVVFSAQAQNIGDWNDEEVEEADDANVLDQPDVSRPKMFSALKHLGRSKSGNSGKRYLMIEYPWSKIGNASLEVRIIGPEAEKQSQFCKPVYFMSKYGKLKEIDKDIVNKRFVKPHFRNDIEYLRDLFHEYGLPEPESLELLTVKPVAGARADYFYMVLKNPETSEYETTLIFHDLNQWAVDSERLAIELRGKAITDAEGKKIKEIEFDKPCKIMVWLLRDDYVVWAEKFQWPGVENDKPKKSASKGSVPKFDDDDDEDPRQTAKKMEKADKNKNDADEPENAGDDADFDSFGDDF